MTHCRIITFKTLKAKQHCFNKITVDFDTDLLDAHYLSGISSTPFLRGMFVIIPDTISISCSEQPHHYYCTEKVKVLTGSIQLFLTPKQIFKGAIATQNHITVFSFPYTNLFSVFLDILKI